MAQLVNAAVARYVEKGVICPPKLRKGFFSTSVMDNIDYGTSMLFMQPRNMVSVLIKVCDIAVSVFATLQDADMEMLWVEFFSNHESKWQIQMFFLQQCHQ